MLSDVLHQIIVYVALYFVLLLFIGIIAYGSLAHHTQSSQASEDAIKAFLDKLHFPFTLIIKAYYGVSQDTTMALMQNMESRAVMRYRIFGSVFPVLFIVAFLYNMLVYSHSIWENALTCILIAIISVTIVIAYRFGVKLFSYQSSGAQKEKSD